MRYSKCMQAGKELANLKAFVHTQLSKQIVYEIGETLYSGPPSGNKEGERNHVSISVLSPAAGFYCEEPVADCLLSADLKKRIISGSSCGNENEAVPSLDGPHLAPKNLAAASKKSIPFVRENSHPVSTNDSSDLVFLNGEEGVNGTSPAVKVSSDDKNVHVNSVSDNSFSSVIVKPSSDMVRLIQEPKSKVDSHSLRRGIRTPKRLGSDECVDGGVTTNKGEVASKHSKLGERELRNRRVSCLSDRSDSDASEQCGNPDDVMGEYELSSKAAGKCRKPKNGEPSLEEHVGKVNGDITNCIVNGVNKGKTKRINRTNSEDSDSISCSFNGAEPDNDRVDINLLLEISVKDRKLFENKKAKIKRKCADWMLITETEQYYNEKEEILRNKTREETDSDSDSDDGEDASVSLEKAPTKKREKKPLDAVEHSEPVAAKVNSRKDSKRSSSSAAKGGRTANEVNKRTKSNKKSGFKGKGKREDKDQKPRKRLSDAERFLRDNKEYYQFPETRERLRRNTSHCNRGRRIQMRALREMDSSEKGSSVDKALVVQGDGDSSNGLLKEGETAPAPASAPAPAPASADLPVCKNRRGRSRSCGVLTDSDEPEEVVEEKPKKPPESVPPDTGLSEYKTLDSLYFSFEGSPVQESWYQTYQRYIDGVEDNEFVYYQDYLRFVLPYEMPKEYFRDLNVKKSMLSRKRNELAELVRKSPRCHASTLALFSNIFTSSKKKMKRAKLSMRIVEEPSSEGTNTPTIPEVSKYEPTSLYETEEELLFINQCMDQIMKSTIEEENGSSCDGHVKSPVKGRETRKMSKKKSKNKKSKALPESLSSECKVFDNSLSTEIDYRFLANLPQYLSEVSVFPEDTLSKPSLDLLAESCHCECTEQTSCDEFSSIDERTEMSSESLSVCDSETIDSFSSNFSTTKAKKVGTQHKKRRKNLTGWPTQKRRKRAPSRISEDNDSASLGLEETQPKKRPHRAAIRRSRRPFELLEPVMSEQSLPTATTSGSDHLRRSSTRKRSSVLYVDTWPLRFHK